MEENINEPNSVHLNNEQLLQELITNDFREYVHNRVDKENIKRDLETYKGCSLKEIYCHIYKFWMLDKFKSQYTK